MPLSPIHITFNDLSEIKSYARTDRLTLTIGSFDAIHLGHQKLIQETILLARQIDASPALLTFKAHPRKILNSEKSGASLFTLEHRLQIIAQYGISQIFIINFNEEIAQLEPEEFTDIILINSLNCKGIVTGEDFCFGKGRKGNVEFLNSYLSKKKITYKSVAHLDKQQQIVSTTQIRNLIQNKNMAEANSLLGRNYSILGKSQSGFGRGKSIGYPTINIAPQTEITPAQGVYITKTKLKNILYPSITNVGFNPTFNQSNQQLLVETHIFNENLTIKDETAEVFFLQYIRPEQKFENAELLSKQIAKDTIMAKQFHGLTV